MNGNDSAGSGGKIRVLVANRPRLMRELMLEAIASDPEVEIAGEIEQEADLAAAVERVRPDVVIIALGDSDERPSICDQLLLRYPALRVVAIAADRDAAFYYWAAPEIHTARLENSEGNVLLALRRRAGQPGRQR
jgi:chemotaxis response regulator CheB